MFHFNVFFFVHGIFPEILISAIMQHLVMASGAQLVNRDVIKIDINNDVIKLIANLEGVIKTSGFRSQQG